VCCGTGDPLLTEATLSHITSLVAQHGSDVWWSASIEDLLPAEV
jgi:isoleucyl-tRNA synthetase